MDFSAHPPQRKIPDHTLIIHIGMPKTGTSALQRVLSNAAPALAARGFDYLSGFRLGKGIAHHPIASEINSRRNLEGPQVRDFLAYLSGVKSGQVLISSEAFTNALQPAILKTFLKFIDECNARMPTKIVVSLRRIDSFMESMYLQREKVHGSSLDLTDYVAARGSWAKNLFQGLTAVRGRCGVEVVRYEASESFFVQFFDAMGLPHRKMPELSSLGRENIRLGLKAQTVLRHFNQFAGRLGIENHRKSLALDLMQGKLRFEEDIYSYRLLSFADADRLHSQALEASIAVGFPEYVQFFQMDQIVDRDNVTLDPSNVTEADLMKLKDHLQHR